jgi:hypothetical protein
MNGENWETLKLMFDSHTTVTLETDECDLLGTLQWDGIKCEYSVRDWDNPKLMVSFHPDRVQYIQAATIRLKPRKQA